MKKVCRLLPIAIVALMAYAAVAQDKDAPILQCREAVWRAWFANDTKTLAELVPAEAIAISPSEDEFGTSETRALPQKSEGKALYPCESPANRSHLLF